MAPQWTDALMRLTLRGGSVYYLQHSSLSSPEPHYFIVLNINPHGDSFLVLAVASSGVEKVRRRNLHLPSETLVEILPGEHHGFPLHTIVDCNHWFRVTKEELLIKLKARVASEKDPLPPDILAKLRQGVLASPLIEAEIKDLLRS
jgi:hypothetical protein